MKLHELTAFSDLVKEKTAYRDINILANSIIKTIISFYSWSSTINEQDNAQFLNIMFISPISLEKLTQTKIFNVNNWGMNAKLKYEFILALENTPNNKVYYEDKTLEALFINLAEKSFLDCAKLVMSKVEESRLKPLLEKTQAVIKNRKCYSNQTQISNKEKSLEFLDTLLTALNEKTYFNTVFSQDVKSEAKAKKIKM
jgi:hypothetical protein